MEVLYLDRLIAVNFLIDYCLLLAAGRVCGAHLRRGRFALAALIGAAYAGLGVLPGWGWLLDKGFDIIQTDWCGMLKNYIENRNR